MRTLGPTTWWVRPTATPVERIVGHVDVLEVLDRVLDKGIVIEASVRMSLIDLTSVDAQMVVASVDTYLRHANALSRATPVTTSAHPRIGKRVPSQFAA